MVAAVLMAVASATVGQTSSLTHVDTYADGLAYPGRVAATASGGVYVTEQSAGAVLELDDLGVLINTFAVPEGPTGVAVHPDGRVFVARADGQVGFYDDALLELGVVDAAPFTLAAPNDMAYDMLADELYVVDSGAHRVLVFAESESGANDWAAVRAWGMQGSALSEFQAPQSIALDPSLGHVILTDADNARMQVFTTNGVLDFKFGYRTLYLGDSETAWFPRSGGAAVDLCGNIYVSDALMGTVRVFSPTGDELDAAHLPALTFGTGAGELRIPMDLQIADGVLYVVSGDNAAVELYDVACTVAAARGAPATGDEVISEAAARKSRAARPMKTPDNPAEIAEAIESQSYSSRFDLNRDRRVDAADLEIALTEFGAGTVDDFLGDSATARSNTYEAPHVIDLPYACGRCHNMDGMPGGGMVAAEGQENLCRSCHSSSGVGMGAVVPSSESGLSHPIGIPADQGHATGPEPDGYSEMDVHLDNGNIRCGTCHNPHNSNRGSPYLRANAVDTTLCGECHEEAAQLATAGHGDATADPWSHYDWSQSNRSSCRRCHSGNGYIDFTNGLAAADQNGDFRTLDCLVCHATHGKPQDEELLRSYDDVTLPGDVIITDAGPNATCMNCHNGRYAPGTGHLTPHYLLGGVMLTGVNGADFGNTTLSNSAHTSVAACVVCHMAPSPAAGNPGAGKVGEHSFNMAVHAPEGSCTGGIDDGEACLADADCDDLAVDDAAGTCTLIDPDHGFENVDNTCGTASCHPGLPSFNRTAHGDYDGDGTTEGIQDEVQGLLDIVLAGLGAKGAIYLGHYPYWSLPKVCDAGDLNAGASCTANADCDLASSGDGLGTCVAGPDDAMLRDAIWNYEFVDNDASLGIHNTSYAVGLLQLTYEQLAGFVLPLPAALRYTP